MGILETLREIITDLPRVTGSLLSGFGITCLLFILTLIFSLPLGLAISFGSMSKIKPIRKIFRVFVWIVRGIPLMLQIFIFVFGPGILFGVPISRYINEYIIDLFNITAENVTWIGDFILCVIAFVINYACYFSEIFRGGIEAIPRGQKEAGLVLGMTKGQIFKNVTLMQVVKRILAPISNEVITLVKDTALANTVAVVEIMFIANKFQSTEQIIWPLFYSGAFYLVFVGVLTLLFSYLEKKLNYYKV